MRTTRIWQKRSGEIVCTVSWSCEKSWVTAIAITIICYNLVKNYSLWLSKCEMVSKCGMEGDLLDTTHTFNKTMIYSKAKYQQHKIIYSVI